MNLRYVAAAGAAALLLTGCQAQPPGAAAVVDGHTISMERADDAAEVYCRLTLVTAQQQGVSTVSNSEVRRQAVSDLVLARVADRLARERDIDVPTSAYTLNAEQRANVARTVSSLPARTAVDVVESSQRTFVIATLIGEQLQGKELDVTKGTDDLQSAGLEELLAELKQEKVRYDPRFGLTRAGQPRSTTTGSLSVSEEPLADGAQGDLPSTQRCA
ncbi:hypothetical protein ASD11_12010 [Aeromicrobium sp. Root495]|uniref:hypothetical protein n=1 Tax=Aeromicrobium sp. Root495 TaxID=1736550 RepID=UPI0006FFA06C|nr:hypothetical protein [Aeromicrobium sp. Root495]KQY60190.1 hypothetical protein ASD11_12010 [Aeromicrobium sp. Root495]